MSQPGAAILSLEDVSHPPPLLTAEEATNWLTSDRPASHPTLGASVDTRKHNSHDQYDREHEHHDTNSLEQALLVIPLVAVAVTKGPDGTPRYNK